MAAFIEDRYATFKATNDLTGKQYYAIALDTSNEGQVVLANAQTLPIIGVLFAEGKALDAVQVILAQNGTYKGIYGGTVAIGDALTADSAGKLITTTTAGDMVIGIAKEAGVTGEIHEVIAARFRYR